VAQKVGRIWRAVSRVVSGRAAERRFTRSHMQRYQRPDRGAHYVGVKHPRDLCVVSADAARTPDSGNR
jgi:hypothetical protein